MLVRAYRLTDRLSVTILKSAGLVIDETLAGISVVWQMVWRMLRPVFRLLALVLLAIVNLFRRAFGQGSVAMTNTMARRAARAEIDATIVEDPLKRQNRMLSLLTVGLLAALIAVVLWATSPSRGGTPLQVAGAGNAANQLFVPTSEQPVQNQNTPAPAVLATPVPTATPLPEVLDILGALAYTQHEKGQTDIWVVPVGSRAPIRFTNDPADERDPAWSPAPNDRRLAYASNQDGNWELYVHDLNGGVQTRLTYDLSFQAGPAWSPDGLYLVYESYQGSNLDIYIMRSDGSEPPIRLPGNSALPDFSPAWSPDGRRIAFVSWRDGNQDIYVFNLDDQVVSNVTNTPNRQEDHPSWYPGTDGDLLAYSAFDEGFEKIFVKPVDDPGAVAQVLSFGHAPSWSPNGSSLIYTVSASDGDQIIASPFSGAGAMTSVISVPSGASGVVWTATPLPAAVINAGSLPSAVTGQLYVEQVSELNQDPPFALSNIGVNVEQAVLSDRVNDSFIALREATLGRAGWDYLGRLDDAFWPLERPLEPGIDRRNWHMTGRAFSTTRNSIVGFPPPVEVVREDRGVETLWRQFVRVADDAQDGQLGEPLRNMPWDFASRTGGDVQAHDQGGRLKTAFPEGYYVDFTQLAEDFSWQPMSAGDDWRANSNSINFWVFYRSDGLDWYTAMREIYAEGPLINFAPTATAAPVTSGQEAPPTAIIQPTEAPPTPASLDSTPEGDSQPASDGG
ncbi:MAG: PD40 domain-containing protein [Anaerolineae bacterium]|nr:PD40 domain-containing protein [Anaerolineae bacterium]